MKIKSFNTYNTGGNCMVMFIDVDGCGSVKQIGYGGENINGLLSRYEDCEDNADLTALWYTDSWKELIDIVGKEAAVQLYKTISTHWPYTDHMTNVCEVHYSNGTDDLIELIKAVCKEQGWDYTDEMLETVVDYSDSMGCDKALDYWKAEQLQLRDYYGND